MKPNGFNICENCGEPCEGGNHLCAGCIRLLKAAPALLGAAKEALRHAQNGCCNWSEGIAVSLRRAIMAAEPGYFLD